jgi:hypothetical protein
MKLRDVAGAFTCINFLVASSSALAGYHLERVSPVLNQPTHLSQAPGDPANIIYYTTRIHGTSSGYFANNTMGGVWRFDLNTRISTEILNFASRSVTNDCGIQSIAFHPDFNASGKSGFGKIYVASAEKGTTAVNRVEEFLLMNSDSTFKSPASAFITARTVLKYNNSSYNNHTLNWIGFDPNALGAEASYLYISTGDGSFQNSYNFGYGAGGRPSQNPMDLKGKFLRVDISGGDDYPTDTNKNFSIPSSNPIPKYNSLHPSSRINGLGEVYLTGIRNAYRASFDRANSDIYWGDVGENAYEEVCFFKAGSNVNGPPVDYGWPQLEGNHASSISGAPHNSTNPFTGAVSVNPVREYVHAGAYAASIGGFVYRGPIEELRGKYFYGDFVRGKIWMLEFDRDMDQSLFNGANGELTDVTATWNEKILDRSVPSYAGDNSLATMSGIDHVVSFGEDQRGNLYVIDFGFGTGFDGQYAVNGGEIFMLVPDDITHALSWAKAVDGMQFSWIGNFKLQSQSGDFLSSDWQDHPAGGTSPVNVSFDHEKKAEFFRLMKLPE